MQGCGVSLAGFLVCLAVLCQVAEYSAALDDGIVELVYCGGDHLLVFGCRLLVFLAVLVGHQLVSCGFQLFGCLPVEVVEDRIPINGFFQFLKINRLYVLFEGFDCLLSLVLVFLGEVCFSQLGSFVS